MTEPVVGMREAGLGPSTFQEGKAGGAYLLGQDNLLLHRLLGSLHGNHWGRRDREWGRPCWPLTLQSGVGMGQLAAWVWYKVNGTGRGLGSHPEVPGSHHYPLSPPPSPSSAGLRGHTRPKAASPLDQAGWRIWAVRVAVAGSQLPMTA